MTPIEAVGACSAIYGTPPSGFSKTFSVSGVVGGIMPTEHGTAVVFRGSDTAEDWFRDLDAVTTDVAGLGDLHAGFTDGLSDFLHAIAPDLSGVITLAGHSLGAARACIAAGMLALSGVEVGELYLFGCPKPGTSQLAKIVKEHVSAIHSYRNGNDPVPLVPDVPWLYAPVVNYQEIGFPADPSNPFLDHLIANYMRAIATLCAPH